MNISDIELPSNYNFYHTPFPEEARLIIDPLKSLQQRIHFILQEWESPILNDCLFLSNYMMCSFNPAVTPLMKILTGLELMLNKLEEWEVCASKKLNSTSEQMVSLKQLIIRHRKI
jgi:midasin